MPAPAILIPTLFRGAPGTTQGSIRPVSIGGRPYTSLTAGKRSVNLNYFRNSANATPNFGSVGVFGVERPYPTAGFGVDASGRLVGGWNPYTSSVAAPLQTGTVVERIIASGGVATGISFIEVLYGGADVTSAPTVVFTGGGGASAAATAIIRDRRVVGITITNAGTGYTSAPVITFTGGTMGVAPIATCGIGQLTTINTHILYAAHAPLAATGAFWWAEYNGKIISCSTSAVAAFNNADDGALDPDQHIMGISSNCGFTVATGTHPDGTTTIGVLTLAAGIPNGALITVYKGTVREISALATHQGDTTQTAPPDILWAVVGAAGDNSNTAITVSPAQFMG